MPKDRPIIDVDDPGTWPAHVQRFIEPFMARLQGTTEYTSDLAISPEEDDAFQATLSDYWLKVYHGTRLLDHETAAIQGDGLQLAGEDLVSRRIKEAFDSGVINEEERDQLLTGNLFGGGEYVSNREGQVCFFMSRHVFDDEVASIWRPMATWGGEVIYFGSDISPELESRLRQLGSPSIIVAAIDVSEQGRVFLASPGILHSFVGKSLGLVPYDCDIFYRAAVPGTQILNIWQPGDKDFDRHPDLVEALATDWDV